MKFTILIISSLAMLLLGGCSNNREGVIEASGTLEATEVKVSAKVPGQVQQIFFEEGRQIRAGDTLVVLDRATLELQWKQAQAGVELADAQYRLLVNGAREEDVRLAEESLRQAEASYKIASEDHARMKDLLATSTITQRQYDEAEVRLTIATAQRNSAKENLQKLENFARPEDLAAARARLNQARATEGLLRKQLSDATVVAPVSGTATLKPVEVGELISAGSVVATIARLEKLNLMIYVNESELGKVRLGGEAEVVIDSYPEKTFPGRVVYISPVAEFTPKNVQTKEDRTKLVFGVKLEVENAEGILKAGMPADAYLH